MCKTFIIVIFLNKEKEHQLQQMIYLFIRNAEQDVLRDFGLVIGCYF